MVRDAEGKLMARLLQLLGFGCRHSRYTWPRQAKPHTYVRCLDCGERLPYSFDTMERAR
jgi:ribosomal protein S27E